MLSYWHTYMWVWEFRYKNIQCSIIYNRKYLETTQIFINRFYSISSILSKITDRISMRNWLFKNILKILTYFLNKNWLNSQILQALGDPNNTGRASSNKHAQNIQLSVSDDTIFLSTDGTFAKIDYRIEHKTELNKYWRTRVNQISPLEINKKKIRTEKSDNLD